MKTFFRWDKFFIWIWWWWLVVEGMNIKILCKVLVEVIRVNWLVEGILKYILNEGDLSVLIFTCLKKMFLDFNHFSSRAKWEREGVQA